MGRGAHSFASALLLALLAATPAAAATYQFSTPIAGDSVPVTMTLTDHAGGGVDVTVSIPPGSGDLLGLFGNVVTQSLVSGMYVFDPEDVVSQWQFKKNQVWKVGGGNTMSPVKNWDWGLQFEGPGCGGLPVENVSFRLKGPGITVAELTGAANQGWVFGVRIQDTGGPEGSAKIGMPAGTPPVGQAPTVAIAAPASGALLASAAVPVSGTFTGASASVTVNGTAATLSGGGWSATLSLADGPHTLTATATNAAGSASDSASITVDTTPPTVTITAPANGALTTQASVLVTGTVADASPIASFTLNGTTVALVSGAFSTTLALAPGANPITAQATDAAGHVGMASVTVSRGAAPVVAITSPASGALLTASPVAVSGTVTGTAPIAVVVNGVTASVSGGTFTANVPLTEGPNTLGATATNAYGSDATSVTVTLDTLPPAVDITSPADGSLTVSATALVTGTVLDASPIASVTVNGVVATLSGSAFSATVPLVLGANPITATGVDAAGHAGSDAISVTRGAPPAVSISAPAQGFETAEAEIAVSGTVLGTEPVSVSVNGVVATVSGGSFSATLLLVEGANTLTATATNAFGSASDAVSGTRTAGGPPLAISIATPPDGALVSQATVAVAGLVSDPAAQVTVQGSAATVTGTSYVAPAVALEEGPNTLVATATRGSETAQAQVQVTYNAPPRVVITSPVDGTVLRQAVTDVEGVVDDPTAFVDVNGVSASVRSGGGFIALAVPLEPGENELLARAVDPVGAQGMDQARVTRDDGLAPRLRIVLVDRTRFPFDLEDHFSGPSVVAHDLASFLRSLEAATEIDIERFQPPIDAPTVGTQEPVHLYVFAEEPGDVTLPLAEEFSAFPIETLRPIEELPADLIDMDLEVSLAEELLPPDFDARYFARFDLELGLGGGGS